MTIEKTPLSEQDMLALVAIKHYVREKCAEGLVSTELALWLFDNVHLPVHNLLAANGIGKHDDGQLS
jgi:hypothetical protein